MNKEESKIVIVEQSINRLKKELDFKYSQLGKDVYEVAERKISEINDLVDLLVELKIELNENLQLVCCEKCFHKNSALSNYCSNCGRQL